VAGAAAEAEEVVVVRVELVDSVAVAQAESALEVDSPGVRMARPATACRPALQADYQQPGKDHFGMAPPATAELFLAVSAVFPAVAVVVPAVAVVVPAVAAIQQ
jgi:hypothetical protein